jgi:hypothetical protein
MSYLLNKRLRFETNSNEMKALCNKQRKILLEYNACTAGLPSTQASSVARGHNAGSLVQKFVQCIYTQTFLSALIRSWITLCRV